MARLGSSPHHHSHSYFRSMDTRSCYLQVGINFFLNINIDTNNIDIIININTNQYSIVRFISILNDPF